MITRLHNHTMQTREQLDEVIDEFILANDLGFIQGSDSWKLVRGGTVGGSEQATIEGKNKYSSELELIKRKLGLSEFNGSLQTRWGNLFETLIEMYTAVNFNTIVKGTEAFLKGRFSTQSYSPDGIGVVELNANGEYESGGTPNIVLFEFKCPYSRKFNNTIPEHYRPQLMAGLDTINIATTGIFIQAMFRRCTWKQLGDNPHYDRSLWTYDIKSMPNPLAYGFIMLRFSSDGLNRVRNQAPIAMVTRLLELYAKHKINVADFATIDNNIADIGDCAKEVMEHIMEMMDQRLIVADYSPIVYLERANAAKNTETVAQSLVRMSNEAKANKYCVFGMIPYKLFKVTSVYEPREAGYLDQWKPKIDEVIDIVKRCKQDPDSQMKILGEYLSSMTPDATAETITTMPNADLIARLNAAKNKK